MIIKIIPETDEEIASYKAKGLDEIEHTGVREYLFFGNKIDSEGDLADFHEWHGGHWYLMNKLTYFYETVNDNRREVNESKSHMANANQTPHGMIKRGGVNSQNIRVLDVLDIKDVDCEEGAFDEDEQKALEVNDHAITVEELDRQAEQINNKKPSGLRLV